MRLSDRVTGPFLVGLGALTAYGGSRLPAVPGQDVGPAAFPMIIGIGLAICGAMIGLGIGHSFEVEEDEPGTAGPGPFHLGGRRALVPPALLIFYTQAVDRIGFLATGFVITLISGIALGARPRLAVPVAICATLFIHLVFSKLLRVPLPDGLLPSPW
jgi:putative tricarboxylic transport membrane protein